MAEAKEQQSEEQRAARPPHAIDVTAAVEEAELARAPSGLPRATGVKRWSVRLPSPIPVIVGAILGANARYLVGEAVAARWGAGFPWATLLINTTGSLIIGFSLALVVERRPGRATARLFVATGFLGSYTTFSTFSDETVALVQRGASGPALVYILASLALGFVAAGAGVAAAHLP